MSAAERTSSTDESLMRAIATSLQLGGEGEGEAIGHAGDVVGGLLWGLAALDQIFEDHPHGGIRASVLGRRARPEIDPLGPRISISSRGSSSSERTPARTASSMSWLM